MRDPSTSSLIWMLLPLAAIIGCATPAMAADMNGAKCQSLLGHTYPSSTMSMPSSGAAITSARWISDQPAVPAYCEVAGAINPVDAKATPILFAINLPSRWNEKVVQLGGGGLNGTLVRGTGPGPDGPPGSDPLAKGYVTLGTDGGHPVAKPDIGVFFLNDEALLNHAYGANRKAHDLSLAVIANYYGKAPRKYYFMGSSQGGREAMSMLQLFPQSYDGVVAVVPAVDNIGTMLAKYNAWRASFDGGWMDKAKIDLLQQETAKQCDGLDGLVDGVISKYRGCASVFDFSPIRCPGGLDKGDSCLSDQQIKAAKAWRSQYDWHFPIKNGYTSIQGWSIGGEGLPGSVFPWIMLGKPPEADPSGRDLNAGQFVRFGIMKGDPNFRGDLDFNNEAVKRRIMQLSDLLDANDPNLSRYRDHGGKLIIEEHTSDYAISPESVFQYYDSVVHVMGQASVDSFVRLFVNPGVNHGGQGQPGLFVPNKVDLLDALDKWASNGSTPNNLTMSAYDGSKVMATKPLCRYPTFPKYRGTGDAKKAASFVCMPL